MRSFQRLPFTSKCGMEKKLSTINAIQTSNQLASRHMPMNKESTLGTGHQTIYSTSWLETPPTDPPGKSISLPTTKSRPFNSKNRSYCPEMLWMRKQESQSQNTRSFRLLIPRQVKPYEELRRHPGKNHSRIPSFNLLERSAAGEKNWLPFGFNRSVTETLQQNDSFPTPLLQPQR